MRPTTLVLFSALLVATARAHSPDVGPSSLSPALLAARDIAPPSTSMDRMTTAKRDVLVEELDVEALQLDAVETPLEARHKKHHKASHHRSSKHSDTRRSGHKHHSKSHHHTHHHSSHADVTVPVSGRTFSGKGTFFQPNRGACGRHNTAGDKIVALSADIYQHGTHCFKQVSVCHNAKCVEASVADLCPGCHRTSLDMSPSLFKELANPELGVIDIHWSFA